MKKHISYSVKALLVLAALCACSIPALSQFNSIIKGVAKPIIKKEVKKAAAKQVSEEAVKKAFVYGGERIGKNTVENAVGKQAARTVVRNKVYKEIEQKGIKSILQYSMRRAAPKLEYASSTSAVKVLSHRSPSFYADGMRTSMGAAKKSVVNGSVPKVVKVVKSSTGNDALKAMQKADPQLYKAFSPTLKNEFNDKVYQNKFVYEELKNGDKVIRNTHPDALSSKITVRKDGSIMAESGCTRKCGAQNILLDHPKPSTKYVVDNTTTFQTDKLGRTVYAEADRTVPVPDAQLKPDLGENQRKLMKLKDAKPGDDAGHILQRTKGGINEGINLTPMPAKWQETGPWRTLERDEERIIDAARANGAKKIISRRKLIYEGNCKRPSRIEFSTIIDGKVEIAKVIDVPQ